MEKRLGCAAVAPAVDRALTAADAPPRTDGSAVPFAVPVALFVLSGAAGLVDQLCFAKYLGMIVGSTAHAVSAVLAAFMTGLALGAHWGGRLSSRIARPLLAYGVLELVVAGAVLLSPLAFQALTPLYVSAARAAPESLTTLSALRWALAMLVVIVPTTAMGATLPLLSRALGAETAVSSAARAARERRLSGLYAANTVGGALGALLAAYAILPALGLRGTLFASAAASAVTGLLALWVARRGDLITDEAEAVDAESSKPPTTAPEPATRELAVLTLLAFASGALVFACEVIFTHLLSLVIGNSAYAFGLILAIFLFCLSVGASRAGATFQRLGPLAVPLSLAATAAGLALMLPLWDELPQLFLGTGETVRTFAGREVIRGVATFAILALPVTLMGLTFPLLLARVASSARVGRLVGRLTSVNTVGAVLGSLCTGYLLLPELGAQRALGAVAATFAALAIALLAVVPATGRARGVAAALAGVAVLALLVAPRWDLVRLTSGANVYFDQPEPPDALEMVTEDVHGGVTSVTRTKGVYTLYTNGKFQGNTGWEMKAQRYFAHYPCLFVRRFDSALVIGLGTGTTLGTLAAYPWREFDVVEISPAIVKAADRYFRGVNRSALHDPRVSLHLGDGRNHLLLSDARYDLIGIELTSIWFAGAANLYSREFYRLVHQRLAPGGVFQQWVQLHHVTPRDFATIVNTLRAEFSHVVLFYGGGQGILVASDQPLVASRSALAELEARPAVRETLPDARGLASLFADALTTGAGLDAFLDDQAARAAIPRAALISTDDNAYLEYATPRGNVLPWRTRDELVAAISAHRRPAEIDALLRP